MTTAPRTWVVGEVVTAAELNTEIRDQFADILSSWTAYTPVWSAAVTAPSLGNGSLAGRHKLVGKTCTVIWEQVMGSSTTFGSGTYAWTMPFTAASPAGTSVNFAYMGSARAHGGLWFNGVAAVAKGGNTAKIFGNSISSEWSPTQPMTWTAANSQYLNAQVTYEIA